MKSIFVILMILGLGLLSPELALSGELSEHPMLILSANDQRSGYSPTKMYVVKDSKVGALTAMNFSTFPPAVTHIEGIPNSVIGPPKCVAATKNGETILVASSMKTDSADPTKLAIDNKLTLLRWSSAGLKIIDQIEIGLQPSGVTLTRDGRHAFVTLRAEGAIAAIELSDGKIRLRKKTKICALEASVSHIALSPDEKMALVTLHDSKEVLVLKITSDGSLIPQQSLSVGPGPYGVEFVNENLALVACTDDNAVHVLVKTTDIWNVKERVTVGRNPEGIALSSDLKTVAVSCFNGFMFTDPNNPWYGKPPGIYILTVQEDGHLKKIQTVDAESMVQSAVFTPDNRYLVAGQYGLSNIIVFENKQGKWTDTTLRINVPGQAAALSVAGH